MINSFAPIRILFRRFTLSRLKYIIIGSFIFRKQVVYLVFRGCLTTSVGVSRRLEKSLEDRTIKYQEQKLDEWNSLSDPITAWLTNQEQKLESSQEVTEDLGSVQKQHEETDVSVSMNDCFN